MSWEPRRKPSGLLAAGLVIAALAVIVTGCDAGTSANPCLGIDCSGHGTCTTDGFWALCACEPGFAPVGTSCVGGGDAGDAGDVAEGDDGGDTEVDIAGEDGGETGPYCGDGVVSVIEECDDGNDVDGDGCDVDCTYSCHVAADCEDGNICGDDFCVTEGLGRLCRSTPIAEGTACDDHSDCTLVDTCDAEGNCVGASPAPADTPCDDGSYCNGSPDACDGAGNCLPISFPPCPVSACLGGCDDLTATCLPADPSVECRPAAHPCDAAESCDGASLDCPADLPAAAGTPCDDGDDCTIDDVCDGAGSCYGTLNC